MPATSVRQCTSGAPAEKAIVVTGAARASTYSVARATPARRRQCLSETANMLRVTITAGANALRRRAGYIVPRLAPSRRLKRFRSIEIDGCRLGPARLDLHAWTCTLGSAGFDQTCTCR